MRRSGRGPAAGPSTLGAHLPGDSLLHRTRAGVKLAALAIGLTALATAGGRWPVLVGAALVLAGTAVSRVGIAALWGQVRPVLWFAVIAAAVQVWTAGPEQAVLVAGLLLVAVAAAGLVTLTTSTQDLLDAVVAGLRPLRRFGVDPERVALVLALAVRSIPVVAGLAREVAEARQARGAGRSVRAFAVPLVIRTVRHADRLGEALAARGIDD